MRLPYLRRPGLTDGQGCRWIFGWHVLPGIYLSLAHWQYKVTRERKLHIDIGFSVPARRQIHRRSQ